MILRCITSSILDENPFYLSSLSPLLSSFLSAIISFVYRHPTRVRVLSGFAPRVFWFSVFLRPHRPIHVHLPSLPYFMEMIALQMLLQAVSAARQDAGAKEVEFYLTQPATVDQVWTAHGTLSHPSLTHAQAHSHFLQALLYTLHFSSQPFLSLRAWLLHHSNSTSTTQVEQMCMNDPSQFTI